MNAHAQFNLAVVEVKGRLPHVRNGARRQCHTHRPHVMNGTVRDAFDLVESQSAFRRGPGDLLDQESAGDATSASGKS